MRHCYLFSIKDRFEYFKHICELLVEKYKDSETELFFSVTDFNSSDADIVSFLKNLKIDFYYLNKDQRFNLGLGWNCSAECSEITNDDILVFITNDCTVSSSFDLCKVISDSTIIGKQIYIPIHGCQDQTGRLHFAGGACLWSMYKKDFKIIGNIPESESWSDCAKLKRDEDVPQYSWINENSFVGEDDFVVYSSVKKGYSIVRKNEPNVVARWHTRDLDDEWYSNSETLINRNYLKNRPAWWTII